MLKVYQCLKHCHEKARHQLELSFDLRKKARFKALTTDEVEVGLFLPRGQVLQDGQVLQAESGELIEVKSAAEEVVTAYADDPLIFARVCYHLGNRHTPLQIGDNWLRFQPDHVLQDLVEIYGLRCEQHQAPFEPESGAYHSHLPTGHSH
ncbi:MULTISPECIES: urease accessory protein UreE [Aliagarivorans]|uniref:urease accessory protein UreE n=1 Tax=Aliagarivorans TaxID=882379 RepID=UPI0004256933|nr:MULTISPECIES: urease accessory protein UreE [Aliagarivorans]